MLVQVFSDFEMKLSVVFVSNSSRSFLGRGFFVLLFVNFRDSFI